MIDKLKIVVAIALIVAGMAAFYYFDQQSTLLRTLGIIACVLAAAGIALTSTPGREAWEFAKGSRTEVRRVVWPTRRETVQGTLVVIGLYLWLLDTVLFWLLYDLTLGVGT